MTRSDADDLMASPASVGTTLLDALGNTYFGERDLIKLAFDDASQRSRKGIAQPRCAGREPRQPRRLLPPRGSSGPGSAEPATGHGPQFRPIFQIHATNVVGSIALTGGVRTTCMPSRVMPATT